ncbi:hypothetical protein IQ283_22585 [Alkalihalobacillus hwajinpoensis]|uniref:hypothetical protein n=1 Tax=Guptibacillus hwajinpoensis TaxID=208199 RepID=UPI00188384D1|nr:hypothetical protein [Pseudalkalibacillus hwajinpoensis]MBF0709388.1 hypothetical protein [Pseudalkalibacillus hwajinpoensis]
MPTKTKLIDCGSKIFVYDYQTKRTLKNSRIESKSEDKEVINLKHLLLRNFVDDRLLTTFDLKLSINHYNDIENRLETFCDHIRSLSGHSKIKYLATVELPSNNFETDAYVKLITDVEIYELEQGDNMGEEDNEEHFEEYFDDLWGDEVLVDVHNFNELVDIFTTAYKTSISSPYFKETYNVIFRNKLKKPKIYLDENAEKYIAKHNVLSYPTVHSTEIYNDRDGFVTINEYSLETMSAADDIDLDWF